MPDEITPELFARLVELAALELAPDEAEYLRRELNNQLSSIKVMDRISLDPGIQPATHGIPYPPENRPALRPDRLAPSTEREAILAQAPELHDGYIVVPEIPHEELE